MLKDVKDVKDIDQVLKSDHFLFGEIKDLECHFGGSGSFKEGEINDTPKWDVYLKLEAIPIFKNVMRQYNVSL